MLPHILKQELIEKELIEKWNGENLEDLDDELMEKVITNVVLNNIPTCKRGDILYLDIDYFREIAKMIWDGEHAVWLEWEFANGYVPKQFAYPEFAMDHWDDSITDNVIRWTSKDNLDELRTKYRVEENDEIIKKELDNYYELHILDTDERFLIIPFHVTPLENHTDSESYLYGLSCTYNNGFDGFSKMFKATSASQIYKYILYEIKLWLQGHDDTYGDYYWRMLDRSCWNRIPKFQPFNNKEEFIKTADWTFVQDIFDYSYVDGDSSPQISLTKIEIEKTTDLTLM